MEGATAEATDSLLQSSAATIQSFWREKQERERLRAHQVSLELRHRAARTIQQAIVPRIRVWRSRRLRSEKLISELEELLARSRERRRIPNSNGNRRAETSSPAEDGRGGEGEEQVWDYVSELRRAAGLRD